MTDKQTLEQKRTQALENLVMFYLKDNKYGAKELRGPVSATNSFRIEFDKPPTQAEIEHLILILNAHKPVLPTEREDRTPLEVVNEALAKAEQQPLERREVKI
jgi:hypothetical protein